MSCVSQDTDRYGVLELRLQVLFGRAEGKARTGI